MSSPAIEMIDLHKRFGNQSVLSGIHLNVPTGTIFALLGPNGAGKTTIVNMLSTLIKPDAGTVRVAGYDVMKQKQHVKMSISLTGQFAAVDEMLTGEENLQMIGRLSGLSAAQSRERTSRMLEQFELAASARKLVKTYSGGMRRKLDLAGSLMADRPILFLDEPTTGLDTISRRTLWDMILKLKEQGKTIFLTTQYLEEAEQLADAIAVIAEGRVVACGTAKELKSRIGGAVLELTDEHDDVIRTLPTTGEWQDVRQLLNALAIDFPEQAKISIRNPSMDDVFVALTTTLQEKEESAS